MTRKAACVCGGNWRNIIKEYEPFIGKTYKDENNKRWKLTGILWAEEDFYYLLTNKLNETRYVSCCATLEQCGFTFFK